MPFTKDDIDAVAITLRVDDDTRFMVMLTRGGHTKRMGSSEGADREPLLVTGRTDSAFEDFMAALPDALLEQGGFFEDEGRDGPRHEWRFELGGGMEGLVYDFAYHAGSASLPDEFADLVTRAERVTHTWQVARLAEERGEAPPQATSVPPPPAAKASTRPGARTGVAPGRPTPSAAIPATRERIALAVLLDLFVLGIPYAYLLALLPDGDGTGPPGAGLVIFALVEFALLQFVRTSPGYWMLGIRAPLGALATVDPAWTARESVITTVVGVTLCGCGAIGLTRWMLDLTPTPYFGLPLGTVLSVLFTLLFAAAYLVGGTAILRTDLRGVWVAGGAMALTLLAMILAWGDLPAWLQVELGNGAAPQGRTAPTGGVPVLVALLRVILVAVPVAFLVGLVFTWMRFTGWRPPSAKPAPAQPAR